MEEMYSRSTPVRYRIRCRAEERHAATKEDRVEPIFIPYSWIRWIGIAALRVSAAAMDWESILLPVSFSLLPTFEY